MIRKTRIVDTTRKLIAIDSQNPPGNEAAIAAWVKKYIVQLKLKVEVYDFMPHRTNIIAYLPGRNPHRSILITPHLDTVPVGKGWKHDPFAGIIAKGKLYGLGATDCKGNVAVCLEALHSMVEDGIQPGCAVIFAATADEETGSQWGLIPLLDKKILQPDAAVVLDSDEFDIITTQKGLIHMKIIVKGKRAHGAYPWKGVNAIEQSASIIRALHAHTFSYTPNVLVHPPTINIGTIKGGDKVNVVADLCEFEVDVRFTPGMTAQQALSDIRRIIKKTTRNFSIEIEGIQQPFEINKDAPLVMALQRAMRACKIRPRIKGSEGATTITFFQQHHIPAVATGCGAPDCAHVIDEYVGVDSLYKGAAILEKFLITYEGK